MIDARMLFFIKKMGAYKNRPLHKTETTNRIAFDWNMLLDIDLDF